jgi:hypothetical protein
MEGGPSRGGSRNHPRLGIYGLGLFQATSHKTESVQCSAVQCSAVQCAGASDVMSVALMSSSPRARESREAGRIPGSFVLVREKMLRTPLLLSLGEGCVG